MAVQIAPMLGYTNRHFRYLMRGLTRRAELWTEMYSAVGLLHMADQYLLDYSDIEHPLVCQLGGSDPTALGEAAELVARWGYDEINLNCGCPSPKVAGHGGFGAALMKHPDTVRDAISRMARSLNGKAKLSIKCRLGVDDYDSKEFLESFIRIVSSTGDINRFVIHARKAWLKGVNPAANRKIPPLDYNRVYDIARKFPHLTFSLNGGIGSLDDIDEVLAKGAVEGVMIGRAAVQNASFLAHVDPKYYGVPPPESSLSLRHLILHWYCIYLDVHFPEPLTKSLFTVIKPAADMFRNKYGGLHIRQRLNDVIRAEGHWQPPAELLRTVIKDVYENNSDVLDASIRQM